MTVTSLYSERREDSALASFPLRLVDTGGIASALFLWTILAVIRAGIHRCYRRGRLWRSLRVVSTGSEVHFREENVRGRRYRPCLLLVL